MMLCSRNSLLRSRATVLSPPAIARRAIAPRPARTTPIPAASSPTSNRSTLHRPRPRPRRPSVASASPSSSSAASSSGAAPPPTGDDDSSNDWLSRGLLRISYPLQALLLLLGAAAMAAFPSGFCELALLSCPRPPPQTAIQLAGAALALPCAASLALSHAASVPGRLGSSTYVSLNAGLSLFGLAVAAAASTAVAPAASSLPLSSSASSAAFIAPAQFYSSLLLIGPLALAVACSTAATAYGGQGAGVARALVQAPVAVAAAVQRATTSSAFSSSMPRLFGACSAALVALALAGAVSSASKDPTSALFLRVAASGALFASVAAAVLSDAASRGRSGASTFVKLKQGAVAGCAAAVGAVVGGGAAAAGAGGGALSPAASIGVCAALVLFGGASAWELATVKK